MRHRVLGRLLTAFILLTLAIGVELHLRDRIEVAIMRIEERIRCLPLFTSWIHTPLPSDKRGD